MIEREFAGPDGRIWRFVERTESRREDDVTQVVLELETPGERRVVTCSRWQWELSEPDLAALLERSVPGGASRGMGGVDGTSRGSGGGEPETGTEEPEAW